MDKLFVASVIVVSAGVVIFLSIRWRTIRNLSRQAEASWVRLLELLSDRHLVISHLTDAIESVGDGDLSTKALATATERAQNHLESLEQPFPNLDGLSVADHQLRVCESMTEVTSVAQSDTALSSDKSVSACLSGISELNEKIHLALAAYNDAAITYTTYVNTAVGSLVAKMTQSPRTYRLLDWTPIASSLDSSRARAPKPAGLMRDGSVSLDDSDAR